MLDQLDDIDVPDAVPLRRRRPLHPERPGRAPSSAAIAGASRFALNVEAAGHAFDNHEAPMFWNEAAAAAGVARDDRPSSTATSRR